MPKKSAPSKKRTYMKKTDRQPLIIAAALDIFSKKGFQGATIEEICKASGIAQGTVYIHFKNKVDIFKAVLATIRDDFFSIMRPLFAESNNDIADSGNEALNYIRKKTFLILTAVDKNKGLMKMILRDAPGLDPEIDGILMQMKQFMLNQLEIEHEIFQRMGLVRKANPRLTAQMILGTMAMVCTDELFEKGDMDIEKLSDEFCHLMFFGLVSDADRNPLE